MDHLCDSVIYYKNCQCLCRLYIVFSWRFTARVWWMHYSSPCSRCHKNIRKRSNIWRSENTGCFSICQHVRFFSFSFLEYILVVLTISWLSLRSYWQDSFKLGISCYGFLKLHLNILYCNINFLFSLTHFHHSLVCCTREGRYVIKTSMNIHYILINM